MMTNGVCPHCIDKEDSNHDCKCKSWAIFMVEEDDLDDDGILIVFEDDIKRKESALVDSSFLEQNPTLSEDDKENGHLNEGIAESSKSLPLENLFSLECLIQMETEEKKLQEKEYENEWRRFEEMNEGENEKNMGEGMEEDNKIKVQPASSLFEEEYEEIKAQPPSSLSKKVIKKEMIEEEDDVIKI